MNNNTEHLLLGLIYKEPELIDDCQLLINIDRPFFSDNYNGLFRDMVAIYSESGGIDKRALLNRINDRDPNQLGIVSEATIMPGFKEQIKEYVAELYDTAVRRKLSALSYSLANCEKDELNTSEDFLNIIRSTLDSIDRSAAITTQITLPEAVKQVIDEAVRLSEGNTADYIGTGILSLDRLIHGFKNKTMSIIGARPSVGKSALGLTFMSNMAMAGISCAFISVEMSEAECAQRIMQMRSDVSMDIFTNGTNMAKLQVFGETGRNLAKDPNIELIRTTNRTIGNIRSIVRKLKNQKPALRVVFVDYIQKLGHDREEIAKVSGILTDIATDLDLHVCALAQLNRDGAESPSIKHLKECGRLEEDAHYVILIGRDLKKQYDGDFDQDCNLYVAKNRGGRTGRVEIKYNCKTTRFYDGGEF